MEDLVGLVMKGRRFEIHADMPPHLAERLRKVTKVKKRKESPGIHITNVIGSSPAKRPRIPETIEGAIREYRNRLCSQTDDPKRISAIDAIAKFTEEQLFNLNNLTKEHIDYFVLNKFPLGIATQWVMDVDE
ncbi:hypothetical protein VHEMI02465 [[Torrubiella] hemipterigena]|uniref:Uncharacterized protein n=1 Tax=[Torrubiella] hemipterigena TaxID=1531966 RepID=A0A0A1TAK4_9HYPO|nr:hypothetical protein VHEMI02465 [[Torrubiella] hemipterigena]